MAKVWVPIATFLAGLLLGRLVLDPPAHRGDGFLPGVQVVRAPGDGLPPDEPDAAIGIEGSDSAAGPGPAAGPTLATSSVTSPLHGDAQRAWALSLVGTTLRSLAPRQDLPPEQHSAVAKATVLQMERAAQNYAISLRKYLEEREALGTLDDPPTLLVQARGTGYVALDDGDAAYRASHWSRTPLDLSSGPESARHLDVYLRAGVVPLEQVLVLEEVKVRAWLGTAAQGPGGLPGRGSVGLRVEGYEVSTLTGQDGEEVVGSLRGFVLVRPPRQRIPIQLNLNAARVELSAVGRYVSLEEGWAPQQETYPFLWVPEGEDGVLGDEPVLLQVLADHGGGNPRKVMLNGATYRIERVARSDLWDDQLDLARNRASVGRVRGGGAVPRGHVFRVTRIDWRARLDPGGTRNSNFTVRYQGRVLVEVRAPDGINPSGTWTGEVDVEPGQEGRFEIECSYYGMGEATVHGALVPREK